jgi:cytochrome c-type biogenesis protein
MVLERVFAFFVTGLLATLSPCALPLYPGLLAYLDGQAQGSRPMDGLLGVPVLLGVMTMMLLLGMVIASLELAVGQVLSVVAPLAYLAVIVLGAIVLLGANPFSRRPRLRVPLLGNRLVNAYVYGLLYGPVAWPRSGPFVVSVLIYSPTVADYLSQLILLLAFALGLGLPLLNLS